ncbi:ParB/RepB/Spo0J family partition protein [Streptacidiphilus fuscans]|uniref:ParB N-terminal domain-containing protein n=1 Tax=Streptacidiphilus fuscans TaxID=2789292 RepID=A0A931BAP9_9ACTN|nr:ParB N-terminal domain-containing protein [Streptacidiphilus fuscans]MBF9071772.1 ParB N-terminal domain-containing protein [Streptacidiphilus fuscans]
MTRPSAHVRSSVIVDIHPELAAIPAPSQDELDSLIRSISEVGLLSPIVRDPQGRILDGRARLAACESLGIEPEYTTRQEGNAGHYAVTVNLEQRSLTQGQKAMIYAKAELFPENPDDFRAETDSGFSQEITGQDLSRQAGVSPSRMSNAYTVLAWAPELADLVVAGGVSLSAAYQTARARKLASNSDEKKLEELHALEPELAQQVADGDLSLNAAVTEMRDRAEKSADERRRATAQLCGLVPTLAQHKGGESFGLYDTTFALSGREINRQVIASAITALKQMDAVWQKRGWQ